MYKRDQVISALDKFCRTKGESIEQREKRLGAQLAPIKDGLMKAGDPVLNRNIKLALSELQIEPDEFWPYLDEQTDR